VSRASRASVPPQQHEEGGVMTAARLPIITNVETGMPAELGGLRSGDLVLEINGTSMSDKSNKVISELINASDVIRFLVSRERVRTDEMIKDSIKQLAMDVINEKKQRDNVLLRQQENDENDVETTPQAPHRRQSRRDSANISAAALLNNANNNASPKILHEEIRMSSSRHYPDPSSSSTLASRRSSPKQQQPRNKSEPAPPPQQHIIAADNSSLLQQQQQRSSPQPPQVLMQQSSSQIHMQPPQQQQTQQTGGSQSSPISRRSSSLYSLPADAPIVRLCKIRAYEEQLGFTVAGSKSNPGVFKVNDVQVGSPAANGGLQNGDYIVEISGQNVQTMSYAEVIGLIKARKQEDDLQLLVADTATVQWYRQKKIPISSALAPKMQYIEALLKKDLDELANVNGQYSTATTASTADLNSQCKSFTNIFLPFWSSLT
jgi:membrane-associated protease RseP (regulator of RpoE activity)